MKTTKEHVDTLKRLKPSLEKAFEALSNFLDDQTTYESLLNAHREAEQRLDSKRLEEKGIDTRLQNAKTVEADAEAAHEKALNDADDTRALARLDADKIKRQAEADAKKLTEKATNDAADLIAVGKKKLSDIEAQIENKRKEFTDLADACDDKAKELDQHTTDLEAAKAHIAKLLRG